MRHTELDEMFLSGHAWFPPLNALDLSHPGVQAELRRLWEIHRERLVALHIAEEAGPGSRPWAWWKFDAPEPMRRRIDGKPHPFDNPEREAWVRKWHPDADRGDHWGGPYALRFGLPSIYCVPDDWEVRHESEADYLERHGLLTDDERRAIEALDES